MLINKMFVNEFTGEEAHSIYVVSRGWYYWEETRQAYYSLRDNSPLEEGAKVDLWFSKLLWKGETQGEHQKG